MAISTPTAGSTVQPCSVKLIPVHASRGAVHNRPNNVDLSREKTSDGRPYHQDLDDQPITPCRGPLVVVADDEVVQRRRGSTHLRRTWWTEESIGTVSGLWLQTGADGELLLPIVLSRLID